MKPLHKTRVIVAALLFAASAISTPAFAVDYDTELHVIYYDDGEVVGEEGYSACYGYNWSWGQQSGDYMLMKSIRCDNGAPVSCHWYSWNGSEWEFIYANDCSPNSDRPRMDRPLR